MISQQRSDHSSDDDGSHGGTADSTQVQGGREENDELTACSSRPSQEAEQGQISSTVIQVQNKKKRPRSPSLEESNIVEKSKDVAAGASVSQDTPDHNDRNNNKKTTSKASSRSTDAIAPSSTAIGAEPKHPESILQHRWDNMFERLVTFKVKYGHCLVPNRYDEDKSLGAWVSTQRRHYKTMNSGRDDVTTPLTAERAQRLEGIGFVWATSDPRHTPWEIRFEQLREYEERFGNCLVPIGYKDNVKLANWVSTQRQEFKSFKEGRQTRMTTERIQLLTSIGMIWDAQRGGNRHRGRYRPISDYADADQNDEEESNHDDRKMAAGVPNHQIDRLGALMTQQRHHHTGPTESGVARNTGTGGGTPGGLGATSSSTASNFALNAALAVSSTSRLSHPSVRIRPPHRNVSNTGANPVTTAGQPQQVGGVAPRAESNNRGVLSSLSSPGTSSSLWSTEAGLLPQRIPSSSLLQQQARLGSISGPPTSANILAAHLNRSNATAMMVAAGMGVDPTGLRARGAGLTQSSMTANSGIDALASRLLQQTSALAASASLASSGNSRLFPDQYSLANTFNPLVAGLPPSLLGTRPTQASLLYQYPFAGRLPSAMDAAISPAALLSSALQQSASGTSTMGLGINSGALNYQGLGTGVSTSAMAQSRISASLQLLLAANSQGLSHGDGGGNHMMRNTGYGIPISRATATTTARNPRQQPNGTVFLPRLGQQSQRASTEQPSGTESEENTTNN
mmetsp:Transcript_7524/g.12541  ORF Transcript_7524/g.12541 Transcript_7524/m.12541 type:complete len:740 (-) Transcript_7524:117-2336(-)